ncbi:hypothetical protein [Rhodococcus opacus]|uniref:DUF3263 domain-containing protein n=1 Tax=Rhodococcus opacus (strain B4) TaxID=632772 RepID=C1AVE5_RHOOB|nr:hypothetical protein [Rhodococcus opacus]BAH53635.1 hypothetical protein ROP_53880 [Rhodococcus opacus B4]
MDSQDSAILELACRWLPYGGPPPEEILVDFGMAELRFDQQLLKILGSMSSRHLSDVDRIMLQKQLLERRERRRRSNIPVP